MATEHPIEIARMLIHRHGLRAGAMAQQRVEEARIGGRTDELDRWHSVQAAVAELRRTANQGTAPSVN